MSRGWRWTRAFGVVVAAFAIVPTLSECGAGVLYPGGTTSPPGPAASPAAPRTYTITSPVTTIAINGGAGTVTVTGSSRSTVAVTEQAYYSNSAKPPSTSHAFNGTTLTLSYSCPAQLTCGVSYDVQVPRGLAVRVSNREGAITLTGLAGPLSAQTIAGVITATALASPTVSLSSRAGAITAALTAAPQTLTATTNAGPITLTVPSSRAYKVNAHTVIGQTTVTVRQSPTARSLITATSDLGNVTIR